MKLCMDDYERMDSTESVPLTRGTGYHDDGAHFHIRRRLFECCGWLAVVVVPAVVVVDVGGLFATTTLSSSSSFEYKSTSSGWSRIGTFDVPAAVRDVRGPVLGVVRRWVVVAGTGTTWLVEEAADCGIACKCITILGLAFLLSL